MSAIKWTASQLKRLSESVRKYNAAVTRMARSGKYDSLPNYTDVESEKAHIRTRQQLVTREKQLGRILKKNNPNADKPVEVNGLVVPQYLKKEIQYTARMINDERKQYRESLFGDFEGMSAVRQAQVVANKNLADVHVEDYVTGDDFDDLLSELYPDLRDYVDKYLNVWEDFGGDEEVVRIIERFGEENPEKFKEIIEGDYDETQIDYIYPTKASTGPYRNRHGYNYANKGSANLTPMVNRYENVVRFWKNMESRWLD